MKENLYYRYGKRYKKVKRDEVIKEGAMQSWEGGELQPIRGFDTVGDTPRSFSEEREFYNVEGI